MKQKSDIQEPFLKTKYIDINDNSVTILKSEKKQEDLKNIFKHISDYSFLVFNQKRISIQKILDFYALGDNFIL